MTIAARFRQALTRLRPARRGPGGTRPDNRRIVSMIDQGFSYGFIRRELGVGNARIDGALREHVEGDRRSPLHP